MGYIFKTMACMVILTASFNKTLASEQILKDSFYSQASQDEFVYTLANYTTHSNDTFYYLEIGAGDPIFTSNTYALEKSKKWKGCSIDISTEHKDKWLNLRSNPLIIGDARLTDYKSLLNRFPETITYLSLDIDDSYQQVLEQIPFNKHSFSIITIEHDGYRYGDLYRKQERDFLSSRGYHLLCADVSLIFNGEVCVFEDWWINP